MYQFGPASMISFFSAAATLATTLLVWRRRTGLGARYLAWFTILSAIWAGSTGFEYAATTVAGKQLWSQISYLGVVSTPMVHMLFGLAYGRQRDDLCARTLIALGVIPAITLLLAATNDQHHLIWQSISILPESNLAIYEHGVGFWLFFAYAYIALAIGTFSYLYGVVHTSRHYRAQSMAVLAAALLPVIGNIAYNFQLGPIPGLDWTPISFGLSAALLVLSIDRYRLFDLMPVIRAELMEMMSEGVLAVDEKRRIVDLNQAMVNILGRIADLRIGLRADVALALLPRLVQSLYSAGNQSFHFRLDDSSGAHWYQARTSSVDLPGRSRTGQLVVLRDVTSQHNLAAERDGLIENLQSALAEVSTLSGLLPICPQCKKIRDDTGYWHSVEAYLSERSAAEFTHGICPDCIRELYPDLVDETDQDATC